MRRALSNKDGYLGQVSLDGTVTQDPFVNDLISYALLNERGQNVNEANRKDNDTRTPADQTVGDGSKSLKNAGSTVLNPKEYHWGALADGTVVIFKSRYEPPLTTEQLLNNIRTFWQQMKTSKAWISATDQLSHQGERTPVIHVSVKAS